jgi:type IV secretion system protein VirB11
MRSRLHDQLCHDLGVPVLEILDRSDVTDVLLLEDGTLWSCERGQWTSEDSVIYEPEHREAIIGLIANSLRQEATYEHPNIEGEMEIYGRRFRVTALMPPMVAYPTIAIRKPAQIIYTLEDYERVGILSTRYRNLLERAVRTRESIIVAGAMSSGKSTMLNALMEKIPCQERVGILEDVFELSAPHLRNKNHLHTSAEISLQKLVRAALRLSLNRIIVGEVRGAEALDMLKSWRVGCQGSMTTIHSNSAAAALTRLGSLVQEAGVPDQSRLIAEAVQLIVFIEAEPIENDVRRRVTEIVRVHGINREGQFNLTAA